MCTLTLFLGTSDKCLYPDTSALKQEHINPLCAHIQFSTQISSRYFHNNVMYVMEKKWNVRFAVSQLWYLFANIHIYTILPKLFNNILFLHLNWSWSSLSFFLPPLPYLSFPQINFYQSRVQNEWWSEWR